MTDYLGIFFRCCCAIEIAPQNPSCHANSKIVAVEIIPMDLYDRLLFNCADSWCLVICLCGCAVFLGCAAAALPWSRYLLKISHSAYLFTAACLWQKKKSHFLLSTSLPRWVFCVLPENPWWSQSVVYKRKKQGKTDKNWLLHGLMYLFYLPVVPVLSLHSELGLRVFHLPAARSNLDEIYYY